MESNAPTGSTLAGSTLANGPASGSPRSRRGLTSFFLKVAAIVGMTASHVGSAFEGTLPLEWQCALFAFGGMTFPIMAFLIAEGYLHTSSLKRYALRLGAFALVSQVPYALVLSPEGNVLFTLLLGLVLIYLYDTMGSRAAFWALFCAGAVASLACDWGFIGPIMILSFHAIPDRKKSIAFGCLLPLVSLGLPSLSLVAGGSVAALPTLLYALVGCSLALAALLAYDGRRGTSLKWFFYAYYPLHIAVIGLVRWVMG